MKIEIRTDVVVSDLENQLVIKILCASASVSEWGRALSGLRNEEISSVVVRPTSPTSEGNLVLKHDERSSGLASIRKEKAGNMIEMTSRQLDYVYSFLRKFEEHGIGSVDHVDVEATISGDSKKEAYITFHIPVAATPMTPEEADKWFRT
jgi:hypothetical protein